jgi:ABC-type amino acid transport substrate-binding protein
METNLTQKKKQSNWLTRISIIISLVSMVLCIFLFVGQQKTTNKIEMQETSMKRIQRTGVLRVAYGGFPPYTVVNLNETDPNKQVSGFVVDMINEIVRQSDGLIKKVEWVRLNWGTYKVDMDSKRFDVLADAVYYNIPKAIDYIFTEPFSYFGIACAVVKKDDNRFNVFEDLNRSDIKISYALGYVSGPYAMRYLEKPEFIPVEVGDNAFGQLDYVINNRADVAIQDVPTVVQYVNEHKNVVKALWVKNPPSSVAAGFLLRKTDIDLRDFLNVCMINMKVDGTLKKLDEQYNSFGHFEKIDMIQGQGLKNE